MGRELNNRFSIMTPKCSMKTKDIVNCTVNSFLNDDFATFAFIKPS